MRKLLKYCICLCALSLSISNAHATMIPVGINIDGSLTTNTVNAFGSITSTGTTTVGGVSSGTDLSGGGMTSGIFTDMGDGISLVANVTGNDTDGVSYNNFGNNFLVDLAFSVQNTTADTFRITLNYAFNILANASGGDAFIESVLFLNDTISTLTTQSYTSDTSFGDQVNGTPTGTSGNTQSNAGTIPFVFDVAAGTTLNLVGQSSLRGGVFASNSNFVGDADFGLTIVNVENLNSTPPPPPPNPVPEPFNLGILALGVALLIRKQINR